MQTIPQMQTQEATDTYNKEPKPASQYTVDAYNKVLRELNFDNKLDYVDASKNFVATYTHDDQISTEPIDQVKIDQSNSPVPVWNLADYRFLKDDTAPFTVNPSLWRQAQLNLNNGLFRVTTRTYEVDGKPVKRSIYQVRAFDLSNMTIVETDNHIIVIDPLISEETAKAALNLYYETRPPNQPKFPVRAVFYTHSHIDHYGGVNGVISADDVQSKKVDVYAPNGFLDHAVSENVYAGSAMARRAIYMYGAILDPGDRGQVDSGLGKTTSTGQSGLIPPTVVISDNLEKHNIDGVEIVFQLAEDTEAPSEMLFHFPQFRALCAAEDMTHNLHNLYSLRGAQVRSALAWWKVINDTIQLFAKDLDVIFAQHHWPMWNDVPGKIVHFLRKQRDLYKYLHDQSLRLLNHGRTMLELSEIIELPISLSHEWYNRGYYGTVNHDSKAVYQRYIGWYDANPATLHALPPVDASKRYVEYMGGAETVLNKAQQAFDRGEYRWVVEVVNHVIFADPDSSQINPVNPFTANAKLLQADALEQLGYQAESGPWRNCYLMGAHELRHGVSPLLQSHPLSTAVMSAMTLDQYFDYMGLRFNAPKAKADPFFEKHVTINWIIDDGGTPQYYSLESVDYTLPYTSYEHEIALPMADVTLIMERSVLNEISTTSHISMSKAFNFAIDAGKIKVVGPGNATIVTKILDHLDIFPANFNIVTPRQEKDLV